VLVSRGHDNSILRGAHDDAALGQIYGDFLRSVSLRARAGGKQPQMHADAHR